MSGPKYFAKEMLEEKRAAIDVDVETTQSEMEEEDEAHPPVSGSMDVLKEIYAKDPEFRNECLNRYSTWNRPSVIRIAALAGKSEYVITLCKSLQDIPLARNEYTLHLLETLGDRKKRCSQEAIQEMEKTYVILMRRLVAKKKKM